MACISFVVKSTSVPTEGLVAFWKMDAIVGGTTIEDSSGNNNDLTIGGTPTVVAGMSGNAIRFGTGDTAFRGDNLSLTRDMAISMFIKFNTISAATSYNQVLSFSNGASDTGIGLIKTHLGARVHPCWASGSLIQVHGYNIPSDGHAPNAGTWYHYFLQGSLTGINLWVDAVDTVPLQAFYEFGSDAQYNDIYMKGDDTGSDYTTQNIRIYDISSRGFFNQSEIQLLYNEI